jgi:hypothetical protein
VHSWNQLSGNGQRESSKVGLEPYEAMGGAVAQNPCCGDDEETGDLRAAIATRRDPVCFVRCWTAESQSEQRR